MTKQTNLHPKNLSKMKPQFKAPEHLPIEKMIAIAIMKDCEGGKEDTPGDAGGNMYRWQDYLSTARVALAIIKMNKDHLINSVRI